MRDLIDQYIAEGRIPASSFIVTFDESVHYLGKVCRRGHAYEATGTSIRHKSHANCVVCMRMNAFVWRHEHLEHTRERGRAYEQTPSGRAKKKAAATNWSRQPASRLKIMVAGAKNRAQIKGIPYDLTDKWLADTIEKQNGRCYWTGMPFQYEGADRHPLKPSLDRLVPQLGYVRSNVIIASNFANRARSDTPADEFAMIIQQLVSSLESLR